jgi:hypothetical protein
MPGTGVRAVILGKVWAVIGSQDQSCLSMMKKRRGRLDMTVTPILYYQHTPCNNPEQQQPHICFVTITIHSTITDGRVHICKLMAQCVLNA